MLPAFGQSFDAATRVDIRRRDKKRMVSRVCDLDIQKRFDVFMNGSTVVVYYVVCTPNMLQGEIPEK